jgi:hypothetical protein
MPKDSPRPKQFEWRVVRIKSTPAAIRLAAQRVKEIG